jgi:carbon-monoxide dehydrogenase iron sulfur subunit
MVCPVGAIIPDEKSKKVVAKCDLCDGLEIPACVNNCPSQGLIFEETLP